MGEGIEKQPRQPPLVFVKGVFGKTATSVILLDDISIGPCSSALPLLCVKFWLRREKDKIPRVWIFFFTSPGCIF
jgi:hypothetical protein